MKLTHYIALGICSALTPTWATPNEPPITEQQMKEQIGADQLKRERRGKALLRDIFSPNQTEAELRSALNALKEQIFFERRPPIYFSGQGPTDMDPRDSATNTMLEYLNDHPEKMQGLVRKLLLWNLWKEHQWILKYIEPIRVLDLRYGATDTTLESVGFLKQLQTLDLSYNPIHDAGLVYLRDLTGLQNLNLANTYITPAGLAQLLPLVGLRTLNLTGTGITRADLAVLQPLINQGLIIQM